jgi:DNA replication and repair protein RecF
MSPVFIKRLSLRNFRTYADTTVQFAPGVNCIIGRNGCGKTNLLEAIALISTGRSFRTLHLSDLIRFGSSFFSLEAEFEKQGISHTVGIYYDISTKQIQINQTAYSTFHSLLGTLPSILLTPDDLSLITGSPHERRRFLDLYIAQTNPIYLYHLSRYHQAMKQRNQLLKLAPCPSISSWETLMAESASHLIKTRLNAIDILHPLLAKWGQLLSCGQENISLQYQTKPKELLQLGDIPTHLTQLFKETREKERLLGHTLAGPHRDELLLQIDAHSTRTFSSQGQKRSYLAAIRFAQWECMAQASDTLPFLGIDDVGTQLDPHRQDLLMQQLHQFSQVVITAPTVPSSSLPCHTINAELL